jgi:hypothetical protein
MSYQIRPILSEDLKQAHYSYNLVMARELNLLINDKIEFYLISKGLENKALFIDTHVLSKSIFSLFFPYQAFDWLDKNQQKQVHFDTQLQDLQNQIIAYYLREGKILNLKFYPELNDIRAIQWHSEYGKKINFCLNYTSVINISELKETVHFLDSLFFENLDQLRQRSIKEALVKGAKTSVGGQPILKKLITLLKSSINSPEIILLEKFIENLLQKHLAELFVTTNSEGSVLTISLFTFINLRGYYILSANNPEFSTRYAGSINLFEAFIYLAKVRKLTEIDLNGINSEKNSQFKQSFSGNISPYFELIINP